MSHEFLKSDPETCIRPDYLQLVTVAVFWRDKILLIYRQSEPFKDKYSTPGGHKERDETYHQAACRELDEETGIRATNLEPLTVFVDHDHKVECHGFKHVSDDGVFSSPADEEQDVVGWKALDEAVQLPLTPGLRESLLGLS